MIGFNLTRAVHLTFFLLIVGACDIKSSTASVTAYTMEPAKVNNPFHFFIVRNDNLSSRLGTETQTARPILKEVYPDQILLTFSAEDFASYDWELQEAVLTAQASNQLVSHTKDPQKTIERPELYLQNLLFVVSIGEDPIYGGIFAHPASAMYINFPVVYPKFDEDKLVLTIRPFHTITPSQYDEFSKINPQWNGIKDERIFNSLSELGRIEK